MTVVENDMTRKIRRTGSKEFHYTRKMDGKREIRKKFQNNERSEKKNQGHGEPSVTGPKLS